MSATRNCKKLQNFYLATTQVGFVLRTQLITKRKQYNLRLAQSKPAICHRFAHKEDKIQSKHAIQFKTDK